MAAKTTGISSEFIIHPGEIIADVLAEREMTQADLAKRTGFSEAYVSCVISGKKAISARFAMALEYAVSVPKSFWLNLQANYDAKILEAEEAQTVSEEEKAVYTELKEIVKFLKKIGKLEGEKKAVETILDLRKIFQVSNLNCLQHLAPAGLFRMSTKTQTNMGVLGAWLQLCQMSRFPITASATFNPDKINEVIAAIKEAMADRGADPQIKLAPIMAQYGIEFQVVHNFKGAPVHGFICRRDEGIYQISLTIRGAFADIFWFSLFHELGHLVNGDADKAKCFIDASDGQNTKAEEAADFFASNALLDPAADKSFIEAGDYSYPKILEFAGSQSVPDYIVIGRLQKENLIPYSYFADHKLRYKWSI